MSETRLSYRFGPIERRGLVGPLTLGQFLSLAVTLIAAVVILDRAPSTAGAVIAVLVLLGGAAVTVVPFQGRSLVGWLPIFGRHVGRGVTGRRSHRADTPTVGRRAGPAAPARSPEVPWPPFLRGVEYQEAPYHRDGIGVLREQSGRWCTAVLACEAGAFGLLDPPEQERRLAGWGTVLSASASTPIRRLQWIERTAPAEGDAMARWLHQERDPELGVRGSPLIESYLELIDASAPGIHSHELLLAVQVDSARLRGRGRSMTDVLVEETERIAGGLERAEVRVLGALGPEQLGTVMRTGFDPYARTELASQRVVRRPGSRSGAPLASEEEWDHLRLDGALHATYWIAGWPRVDVAPMFLSSLLAPSGTVRTVSVSFEPLSAERSTREVEAAITRDRADRELRQRFGQSETARQRQAHEAALRREAELAAGHGEVRFSGFVTVSGRDVDDLRRACQETLQHAAMARLELRRLYGQQAEAFTFTLPLARGLS